MEFATFMRNLLPIGLVTFFGLCLIIYFYAPKKPPQEAKDLVLTFIDAQKNPKHVDALKTIYAGNAIIYIDQVDLSGTIASSFTIPATEMLALPKRMGDTYNHSDIKYEWVKKTKGHLKVSSIRHSNLSGLKTPHTLILATNKKSKNMVLEDERWLILKEYIIKQ